MCAPHVRWCERRTPSDESGGAVYSISESIFDKAVKHVQETYCDAHLSTPYMLLGDVAELIKITTGKEIDWNVLAKYSRQRPPKCIAFIRQNVTKTKTMRYYILISLLFSMMLASLCLRKSDECPEPLITEVAQDYHTDIRCEALTLDNVYTYLCDLDVKFPDIVTRQCILETGWLTSYNCLERNNLFGMTGGEKTPENPNGYAIYKAWKHSCRAYLRWQRRRYSDGDYYDFLECVGYAESPTYVDKLKSIKIVFYK